LNLRDLRDAPEFHSFDFCRRGEHWHQWQLALAGAWY
jgi:hypothetical protein